MRHYSAIIATFLGKLSRGVSEISGSLKDENFVSIRVTVACEARLRCASLTKSFSQSAEMMGSCTDCRFAVLMVAILVMVITCKKISKEAPWNN